MNRLGLVLIVWGLAAVPAGAASPDPRDLAIPPQELSKAKGLVRKLGSEVYREREEAQEELAKMGRLARPVLVEALAGDPSPEIRSRCSQLLPRAEAADLQARVDTFLADTELKFEHDLPGWKQFRGVVGEKGKLGKADRELYIEMLKSQPNLELLQALAVSPEAGGRAISDRRTALYLQMNPHAFGRFGPVAVTTKPQQPSLVDIATLLLAEVVVPSKDIPRSGPFFQFVNAAMLVQQCPAAVNAVTNPSGTQHAEPYRRVVVKWLDTRVSAEDLGNYATVNLANQFRNLKETTPLLRRVVTTDGVQGWCKGQALVGLVQRNGKEEVAFLKTLLKDETFLTNVFLGQNGMGGLNQPALQLRDVALALLIGQTGQEMAPYGYKTQQNVPLNPLGYGSYAFPTDEDREAAFKKWAEWEAKPKDQPPAKKDEPKPAEKK